MKKRILCVLLAVCLVCLALPAYSYELSPVMSAAPGQSSPVTGTPLAECPDVPAPSVLLIERETGQVLCEKNADQRMAPASITKVMTLLLAIEAVEAGLIKLDTVVTVSKNAQAIKGSSAFLTTGEKYTVHEMLKAVTVQSANDGSVVLAEAVAGTEQAFVSRMNTRAAELGMTGTHFVNSHGWDAKDHYSTARDIAIMSRELLGHPIIKQYTTIWMDTLRGGTFMLANTNRLVRYYDGTTGLKTGTTDDAGCCISASAERGGMELIAVIMNASTSDDRYDAARTLLDYGFATFTTVAVYPESVPLPIPVVLGKKTEVQPVLESRQKIVVDRLKAGAVERKITLAQDVRAPVAKGQVLGELTLILEGRALAQVSLVAAEDVGKLTWWDVFRRMLSVAFMGNSD